MCSTAGNLSRVFLTASSLISSASPVSSTVPQLTTKRGFSLASKMGNFLQQQSIPKFDYAQSISGPFQALITLGVPMAVQDGSTKLDAKLILQAPKLDELAPVLDAALKKNYQQVSVDIVECPNLREAPFRMTGAGIGDNLRIAEVGGIPNLYPHGTKKIYNLKEVCETCEMPEAFVFGPGAGSFDAVGHNSELVADSNFIGNQHKIANKVCWVVPSAKGYAYSTTDCTDFEVTGNLAISDGCPARKVLRIRAAKRTGEMNYPECMQRALATHYEKTLVSLAGLFLLKSGSVQTHILPDYPSSPRKADEKKDDWLQYMRYYEMKSPMVFASVVHSTETEQHKLRIEHSHGYSENGDSGHYHIDTTPDQAEYEGYFAPASAVYRIDMV